MNCRDCLHTPSGKCRKHDPANADILREGLQYKEPVWATEYRERIFGAYDTMEDILRRTRGTT